MKHEIKNPFGILDQATGEVIEQKANPSKEDLELIREKEKRLAEEAKNNLKSVKAVSDTATVTKRPAKKKPQAPVVGKPPQTIPQQAPQQQPQQTQTQTAKEYLVCFMYEDTHTASMPDWNYTRWLTAEGRGLCFAKIVSMIHDITSNFDLEDFCDPIDYSGSFVLCTGVKLEERVPLLEFIKLCMAKEAKAVDKFMLDYMQAVLKSYEEGSMQPIEDWIRENNETPCTPQVQPTIYTGLEGEDIN